MNLPLTHSFSDGVISTLDSFRNLLEHQSGEKGLENPWTYMINIPPETDVEIEPCSKMPSLFFAL